MNRREMRKELLRRAVDKSIEQEEFKPMAKAILKRYVQRWNNTRLFEFVEDVIIDWARPGQD